MLVASLLKNLLWACGYPVLPSQSHLLGKYRVGAIQTRLPGATNCQIHYPTLDNIETSSSQQHPYFRPEAAAGIADYSRQPVELMQFLSCRSHPCLINAKPVPNQQFPIVIFSHGLGGCMEMYTQLCQQVASYGYWVVALEHEDGSGAYAERLEENENAHDSEKSGTPIFYKRPDDTPYSRTKVINFRRPFLEQRVKDVSRALDYVLDTIHEGDSDAMEEKSIAEQVFRAADRTQGVHLMGHSFGGATMVSALQDETFAKRYSVRSLSLMDCWAFSLDDQALARGCSCATDGDSDEHGHRTLHLLSEAWLTNSETAQLKELLRNSSPPDMPSARVASYYVPNSVHVSFSDAICWLPGFIGRKLWMRGAKEERHVTIRAGAQACVQLMRRERISTASDGENSASILEAFDYHAKEVVPIEKDPSTMQRKEVVPAS